MKFHEIFTPLASAAIIFSSLNLDAKPRHKYLKTTDPEFFKTETARQVGARILVMQRCTGGWPKNTDLITPMSAEQVAKAVKDKSRKDDSTIDNYATTTEIRYLARLNEANPEARYSEAIHRGLDFLLSGQYENGGWSQFWPDPKGYQIHITYNDDAMYSTLSLFQEILSGERPFAGVINEEMMEKIQKSVDKAVEIILATQIKVDGEPTVWCQQHDRDTYAPAKARAYELPSYTSLESANLLKFLMSLPNPDDRVKKAVHGGMKWLDRNKITGMRYDRPRDKDGKAYDARLVQDPKAAPLWARYYDLEECLPFFCDRDGIPRRSLDEIGFERRTGYGWYDNRPGEVYDIYNQWADRYDPDNKLTLTL
ncbi:MAG: pectate lyase [Lachnospiraceae bacterium]|nr:pectate lyase [Lachnospiraceae bacterium]